MHVDRSLVARVTMAVGVLTGAAGLSWGLSKSSDASSTTVRYEARIKSLLQEHTQDLKVEQEESRALSGAVLYVEESMAAVCAVTHANCPAPPGAEP